MAPATSPRGRQIDADQPDSRRTSRSGSRCSTLGAELAAENTHQQQHHEDHHTNQKEHCICENCDTAELWQTDPNYHESYENFLSANCLPQALAQGSGFHAAYESGWVNTNNHRQHIDINIQKNEIRRQGQVIATIQPLDNGELDVASTTTAEKNQIFISIDRSYLASRSGSTWQRRQQFKEEWAARNFKDGWRGHVPLPFCVGDAVCYDTDDETKFQVLQDATTTTNQKGRGKKHTNKGKGHYYRIHQQLRSMVPIEWFPIIARIMVEQMRANTTDATKTDSFTAANDDEGWTPGSRQAIQDQIKEEDLMLEVVLMAAHFNKQNENFSPMPMTKESIKSLRAALFTKDGPGGNFLRRIILHNVKSQQNDNRVGTAPQKYSNEMQQKYDSNMAEVLADVTPANVLTQLVLIAEQDTEYSPLTKEDWKIIKNSEAEVEKGVIEPDIRQYFQDFKQHEIEGEQKEQPPEVKLAQQQPMPWPMQPNTNIKKENTWQPPQTPPTPTEDILPSGPMPLPPQRHDDTMNQQQLSLNDESHGD